MIARPQPEIPAVLMFLVIVDRYAAEAEYFSPITFHYESGIVIDADA